MPRFLHPVKSVELLSSIPFFGDHSNKQSRSRSVRLTKKQCQGSASIIPQRDPAASSTDASLLLANSNRQSVFVTSSRFSRFSLLGSLRRGSTTCAYEKVSPNCLIEAVEHDEIGCEDSSSATTATASNHTGTPHGTPASEGKRGDPQITTPPRQSSLAQSPERQSNAHSKPSRRSRILLKSLFDPPLLKRDGLNNKPYAIDHDKKSDSSSPGRRPLTIALHGSDDDVPFFDVGRYTGYAAISSQKEASIPLPPQRRYSSARELSSPLLEQAKRRGVASKLTAVREYGHTIIVHQEQDSERHGHIPEDEEIFELRAEPGQETTKHLDETIGRRNENAESVARGGSDGKDHREAKQDQDIFQQQEAEALRAESFYASHHPSLWVSVPELPQFTGERLCLPRGHLWRNFHRNYFQPGCQGLSQRWIVREVNENRKRLGLLGDDWEERSGLHYNW